MKYKHCYNTPIGCICIEEEGGFITGLYSVPESESVLSDSHKISDFEKHYVKVCETDLIRKTYGELEEYFSGERKQFEVPIKTCGTEFQERVWKALRQIPYGETVSYGQLAKNIGNPEACRAVGGANNKNRIMIIIPCHRVIGADGSLTGFASGVDIKKFLLDLEQKNYGRLS